MKRLLVLVALAGACAWACEAPTDPASLAESQATVSDDVLFKTDAPDKYCVTLTFTEDWTPASAGEPYTESGVTITFPTGVSYAYVSGGWFQKGFGWARFARADGQPFTPGTATIWVSRDFDLSFYEPAGTYIQLRRTTYYANTNVFEAPYASEPEAWKNIDWFEGGEPFWLDYISMCSDKPFTDSKKDEKQKKDKKPK